MHLLGASLGKKALIYGHHPKECERSHNLLFYFTQCRSKGSEKSKIFTLSES